ncbi:MAG: cytochrome c family protein [Draconibacterium sp.]
MDYRKILFLIAAVLLISFGANAQNFKYIGAIKCKTCHNKPNKGSQYDTWLKGPHAKAMESLKGDEKTDPKCLKCHSTAASVEKSLLAGIKESEGVSCESCHGPGSIYKSNTVMKNRELALTKGLIMPTEEVCITCHNKESPTFKGFNYKEYVAKISHDDPTTN